MSLQSSPHYNHSPSNLSTNCFPDATTDKKAVDQYFIQLLDQAVLKATYKEPNPAPIDKWLAVSSLHKSIRRGQVDLALCATATLLELDPDYLFRRLPVIAYEDIGIANPILCNLTLFASAKRVQSTYGRERLAYLLVSLLSESLKSRAATDIFCFTVSDPYAKSYFESCLSLPAARLVDIALDDDLSLTHRMAAIRLITGYSIRQPNGFTKQITKPNTELLFRLCEAMNLTDVISYQVLQGNSKTEGLNGAILLANELLMASPTSSVVTTDITTEETNGTNAAAFDIYCRSGRSGIAQFVANNSSLRRYFAEHPMKNPPRAIGTLLFIIEGSLLGRELDFDIRKDIRRDIENLEMAAAGIKAEEAGRKLIELVRQEMPMLHKIRSAFSEGCQNISTEANRSLKKPVI